MCFYFQQSKNWAALQEKHHVDAVLQALLLRYQQLFLAGFCCSSCVTSFVRVSLLEGFCSSFFAGQRRTAEKAAAGSGEEREGLGMEVDGIMF